MKLETDLLLYSLYDMNEYCIIRRLQLVLELMFHPSRYFANIVDNKSDVR